MLETLFNSILTPGIERSSVFKSEQDFAYYLENFEDLSKITREDYFGNKVIGRFFQGEFREV